MSAVPGVRGIPDYGTNLSRPRLERLVEGHGIRPLAIAGASGGGKSVLAAQVAGRAGGEPLWVDCAGSSIRPTQVCDALLGLGLGRRGGPTSEHDPGDAAADSLAAITAFLQGQSGIHGVILVLDDLGPCSAAEYDWLRELGRVIWLCSSRLLVTTRSVSDWPADILCEWSVLDGSELALTCDEASELAALLGCPRDETQVQRMREACAGHVAFFAAMAAQARLHGTSLMSAKTPSLTGWLRRSIRESLSEQELRALCAASLLHTGTTADLARIGFSDPHIELQRLGEQLPLVRLSETQAECTFLVHDLVEAYFRKEDPVLCLRYSRVAVDVLTDRADYARAASVLAHETDKDLVVAWLNRNGQQALISGHYDPMLRLMASVPTSAMMKHSSLMALWARVLLETGQVEDALAKAHAARPLAQHERDHAALRGAIVVIVNGLRMLGRIREACALAEEVIQSQTEPYVDDALLAEALLCVGAARIMSGDLETAEAPLLEAIRIADGMPGESRLGRMARNAMALVPTLIRGDFAEGKRIVSPFAEIQQDTPRVQLMFKGNLAVYLVELGRYARAETVIRSVLSETARYGLQVMDGSYLPVLGTAMAAAGDLAGGVEQATLGIAISEQYGDACEAAVNRTYLALMLLAQGHKEESLAVSERAFEALAVQNAMGYGRLAALGIAAAMLALGDAPAARSWVATSASFGPRTNDYHNLRAEMILAMADWADGHTKRAAQRLAPFAGYIRSESSNWQIAMLVRVFPELIGLICSGVGPECVPAHMLAMIPPEVSEPAVLAAETILKPEQWETLGRRMLGPSGLDALVQRKGIPLCHVRLFGGFETAVGGRLVNESDWKKRKARLLFTILVLDQGKGIARDRILEHLWPDMDQERAQGNLYVIWSTMKRVLMGADHGGEKCPYVISVGSLCKVMTDYVRSDVGDFEQSILAARTLRASDKPIDALVEYRRIIDLYRGDLLAADCYDDWFSELRQFYRAEFLDAMLQAGELLQQQGESLQSLSFLRRGLRVDPTREDLYQSALRSQIAAGQRSSAIDTYMLCKSHLSEELGLDPSAETQALYMRILAMEEVPPYGVG